MNVAEMETPSVLIDLDRLERNLAAMQAFADRLGKNLRPHIKTHKIPEIARMQVLGGAVGIACQKVSEAEVFASAGFDDIFVSYNILGAKKLARLASLAKRKRISTVVDHPAVIRGLADVAAACDITLNVLVELETERKRTGVPAGEIVALAKQIEAAPKLHFAGVMVFDDSAARIRPGLQLALAELDRAGIGVDVVSGGGTGLVLDAENIPELTELRTGSYVFNDRRNVGKGWAQPEHCAMQVLATVVSTPSPGRVILDSGSKTLSSDTDGTGYGFIVEYPAARIYMLNEEHGLVDVSGYDKPPVIGEQVHIVPWHACTVTNMHNNLYGVRGDQVEVVWPVAARGMVW